MNIFRRLTMSICKFGFWIVVTNVITIFWLRKFEEVNFGFAFVNYAECEVVLICNQCVGVLSAVF